MAPERIDAPNERDFIRHPSSYGAISPPAALIQAKMSGARIIDVKGGKPRGLSAASATSGTKPVSKLYVLACCVYFIGSSLGAVLINKWLYQVAQFPVVVASWVQVCAAIGMSYFAGVFSNLTCDSKQEPPLGCLNWPRFSIQFSTLMKLCPVALVYVPRVIFTSMSLSKTFVSTYQVARSSAIIFNVILSFMFLGVRPTIWSLVGCSTVLTGLVVGSLDPKTLQPIGLAYGMLGALFAAFYLVIIKRFLPLANNNHITLLNYSNVWSSVLFIPCVTIYRQWGVFGPFLQFSAQNLKVWILLSFSCMAAFSMSLSSALLVKVTSPVTTEVAGAIKCVIQTISGSVIFGESLTLMSCTGIALSICGSFIYGASKHLEGKK